jgi:hypothetical protein
VKLDGGVAANERASMPPGEREEISAAAAAECWARDGWEDLFSPIKLISNQYLYRIL